MIEQAKRVGKRCLHERAAAMHRHKLGRWPNLVRPRTFNEKVLYKCLHDHRDLLVRTADKLAVRDYVKATVGADYLTVLIDATDDPSDLDFARLPQAFVAKANHASGPEWYRIITDKDRGDLADLREAAAAWLSEPFEPGGYEPWYWRIPRYVLVEEFLGDPSEGTPDDLRFYVVNGHVQLVQVERGRLSDHRRGFFLPDWTPLDIQVTFPRLRDDMPTPATLPEMVSVAERLAASTDFARVDLYCVDGAVKFGEITHSPAAGTMPFPETFDRWLGSLWDQPLRY